MEISRVELLARATVARLQQCECNLTWNLRANLAELIRSYITSVVKVSNSKENDSRVDTRNEFINGGDESSATCQTIAVTRNGSLVT